MEIVLRKIFLKKKETIIVKQDSSVFSSIASGVWSVSWRCAQIAYKLANLPCINLLLVLHLEFSWQGKPVKSTSLTFRLVQWPPCVKQNCSFFKGSDRTRLTFSENEASRSNLVLSTCSPRSPCTHGSAQTLSDQLLSHLWLSTIAWRQCLSISLDICKNSVHVLELNEHIYSLTTIWFLYLFSVHWVS